MLMKGLRIFSLVCLVGVLVAWFILGANLGWTKTSVATQHVDEITGIEFPVFENRFVPGVEFLALGIGGTIALAALSFLPNLKKTSPMKKTLILLAISTATLAQAEPLTFDFKDPKGVNNVVFKLDAPLESINGTANGISGTVTGDPDKLESITGRIAVAGETLHVPNPIMQGHMHGEKWLDIKTHPEIAFDLKKVANVKRDGNSGTADVSGTLTLKGISRDITVPVKVSYLPGKLKARGGDVDGDLLVIRSTFTINRSDFQIQAGQSTDKVAEEIEVSLSIAGGSPKKS